jgi:DNA modification methylase
MKMSIKILQGNCLETLSSLEEKSVNTCVTSPPYWGLRDYGTGEWVGGDPDCNHEGTVLGHNKNFVDREGRGSNNKSISSGDCYKCGAVRKDDQLGLEETPEKFVENLVNVFREVRRVLRDDGTVWLNLGDSYCGTGHKGDTKDMYFSQGSARNGQSFALNNKIEGLKSKDLIGIPWRVAFALQADGWYLRQDIIWHKPNPMPEPVKDRCTKSHEYIFLLSKSPKYYYDYEAVKVKASDAADYDTSNKRSVWSIPVASYSGAHFATYPPELIKPCILAGCPEGGTVLDPFGGSGTTAQVASNLNRNAILCELNPEYVEIAKGRLHDSLGMFLDMTVETPQH